MTLCFASSHFFFSLPLFSISIVQLIDNPSCALDCSFGRPQLIGSCRSSSPAMRRRRKTHGSRLHPTNQISIAQSDGMHQQMWQQCTYLVWSQVYILTTAGSNLCFHDSLKVVCVLCVHVCGCIYIRHLRLFGMGTYSRLGLPSEVRTTRWVYEPSAHRVFRVCVSCLMMPRNEWLLGYSTLIEIVSHRKRSCRLSICRLFSNRSSSLISVAYIW